MHIRVHPVMGEMHPPEVHGEREGGGNCIVMVGHDPIGTTVPPQIGVRI